MCLQEIRASLSDLLLFVCNAIEQTKNEFAFEGAHGLNVHSRHPYLYHLVIGLADVGAAVIHHELQLGEAVTQVKLGSPRDDDVLHSQQGRLAHVFVLMAQVHDQSVHSGLQVLAHFVGQRAAQTRCKARHLLLHFGVLVSGSSGQHSANWTELRQELVLVGLETNIKQVN